MPGRGLAAPGCGLAAAELRPSGSRVEAELQPSRGRAATGWQPGHAVRARGQGLLRALAVTEPSASRRLVEFLLPRALPPPLRRPIGARAPATVVVSTRYRVFERFRRGIGLISSENAISSFRALAGFTARPALTAGARRRPRPPAPTPPPMRDRLRPPCSPGPDARFGPTLARSRPAYRRAATVVPPPSTTSPA